MKAFLPSAAAHQNGKTVLTAAVLAASSVAPSSADPFSQMSVNSCNDFSRVVASFLVIFRIAIFIWKDKEHCYKDLNTH